MPAHAAQYWRQEEKKYVLPDQVMEAIDSCETETHSKKQLKQFFMTVGIQDLSEMDYPLREAYGEYLEFHLHLKNIAPHLMAYDRIKQAYIREQMKTLSGRQKCQWRLEEKVLFIPYHSDQKLAMEFDTVRHKPNMVWDFTQPAPWHLKEQIFTTLNAILQENYRVLKRSEHLTGLQNLYRFCVQNNIADIEAIDAAQEQAFIHCLDNDTASDTRSQQRLMTALNICRKTVFLQNPEINWNANIWYVERLNLPKHRLNPSSSVTTISFKEIPMPENRAYAKEYMKYQVGITGQAFGTISVRYTLIQRFLIWLSNQEQNACACTQQEIESYLDEIQESGISDKFFNAHISGLKNFFWFMVAHGHMKRIPFQPEFYQRKEIPQHHDRSVSPAVCEEVLGKLHLLPEHLRCMYLHLWCLGLRISEVCTLKGNAYYRQNQDTWIQVYQVKMKNYKRIPIAEGLYQIMQVYIRHRHIGPDDYLFTNRNGGPYRSATFRQQMKKFCQDYEIDGGEYLFQSHDYRHTVATMLYDNGVSIQGVRDYLGHDYLEMTEQYIDYMPRKIAKANTEFFEKPGNSLAANLKKGGKYGK